MRSSRAWTTSSTRSRSRPDERASRRRRPKSSQGFHLPRPPSYSRTRPWRSSSPSAPRGGRRRTRGERADELPRHPERSFSSREVGRRSGGLPDMPSAALPCVPLVAGGDTVGASSSSRTTIRSSTSQCCAPQPIACPRLATRRVSRRRSAATTDGLTGLHNRQSSVSSSSSCLARGPARAAVQRRGDRRRRPETSTTHSDTSRAISPSAGSRTRSQDSPGLRRGVRTGGDEFSCSWRSRGSRSRASRPRRARGGRATGRADPRSRSRSVPGGLLRPGRSSEHVLEAADAMLYAPREPVRTASWPKTALVVACDGEAPLDSLSLSLLELLAVKPGEC